MGGGRNGQETAKMRRGKARRAMQCIVWPSEKLTTTEIIVSILVCHISPCSSKIMANIAKLFINLQHLQVLKLYF